MHIQLFGNIKDCGSVRSALNKTLGGVDGKMIIAVGGDGTFLKAMTKSVASKVPVLCIRSNGSKGVLAEGDIASLDKMLARIKSGNFSVVKHHVIGGLSGKSEFFGLNEIGFFRKSDEAIRFDLFINGSLFYENVVADGGLFSAAAGSTAYNISAGGPIIDKSSESVVFTPINAHGFNRPVVFKGTAEIIFRRNSAHAFADGKKLADIEGRLKVCKADRHVNVISIGTPFSTKWKRIYGAF